ERFF
ncbi:ABC transporter, ATP-binding domain protein, partial [Vibrio parahaemolyticus AQ3810]